MASQEYEWTTISEEQEDEEKVSFDVLGDEFIGTYLGKRDQANDNGSYVQLRFRGTDELAYFINANWSLTNAMKNVRPNMMVRVTYIGDKDTGQASPMRIFRVDVARPKRPGASTRNPEAISKTS